jgi:hypothetical protein
MKRADESYEDFAKRLGMHMGDIQTWEDLYRFYKDLIQESMSDRFDPTSSAQNMFHYHTFILALEALPEEGDVKAIVAKMYEIFAGEGSVTLPAELIPVQIADVNYQPDPTGMEYMMTVTKSDSIH